MKAIKLILVLVGLSLFLSLILYFMHEPNIFQWTLSVIFSEPVTLIPGSPFAMLLLGLSGLSLSLALVVLLIGLDGKAEYISLVLFFVTLAVVVCSLYFFIRGIAGIPMKHSGYVLLACSFIFMILKVYSMRKSSPGAISRAMHSRLQSAGAPYYGKPRFGVAYGTIGDALARQKQGTIFLFIGGILFCAGVSMVIVSYCRH